jgi:hypothetical protein
MKNHPLIMLTLFIVGGATTFVLGWYLLGMGIGIAQRGYNRVAPLPDPHQVLDTVDVPENPRNWDKWEGQH